MRYLQLFSQLFRMQHSQNLHCHGESPAGSAAWTQRPIVDLVRELDQAVGWITFDQCRTGLVSPVDGMPHRKPTTFITTQSALVQTFKDLRCQCQGLRATLEGSFQGRSMTSHAEGYNLKLVQRIARARVRTDQTTFPAQESTGGPLLPAKRIRLTGKTAAPDACPFW